MTYASASCAVNPNQAVRAQGTGKKPHPIITLAVIERLVGGRGERHRTVCPLCSAGRSIKASRAAKVFRIWLRPGWASFSCIHCGEHGWCSDQDAPPPSPARLAEIRAASAEAARKAKGERLSLARWLWSRRRPIPGTIAERYLRGARGYGGAFPATLAFLPPSKGYAPAVIAAFGMASETGPGVLTIADTAVEAVHLINIQPDGSDRIRDPELKPKVIIGIDFNAPIILAPPYDLLGMAIIEGVEDGLTVFQDTGLGVWASAGWSRMPDLAGLVPNYIDTTTVLADPDSKGREAATEAASRIRSRGIDCRAFTLGREP